MGRLDANGDEVSALRFGSSGNDRLLGLAGDPSGNVFLLGDFTTSISFGLGTLNSVDEKDLFVARLVGNTIEWNVHLSGANTETANDIAAGIDGSALAAGIFQTGMSIGASSITAPAQYRTGFVTNLKGPQATIPQWTRTAVSSDFAGFASVTRAAVDAAGNAAVIMSASDQNGGSFSVSFLGQTFNASNGGLVSLVRMTSEGNYSWREDFTQVVADIAMYPNGEVLACGSYVGSGGISTSLSLPAPTGRDLWVAKFSAIGQVLNVLRAGGPGSDGGFPAPSGIRCSPTPDGGFVLAAGTEGQLGFDVGNLGVTSDATTTVVTVADGSWNPTWIRESVGEGSVADVVATTDGVFFLASFSDPFGFESATAPMGGTDIYLARFAP